MVRYYALENFGKIAEFKILLTFVGLKITLSSWQNEWDSVRNFLSPKIPSLFTYYYILEKKQIQPKNMASKPLNAIIKK